MGNYYEDVYLTRLNRYGNDYQSRILGQRRQVFANLLLKSQNRIDFTYNETEYPAIFEADSQNETKTLIYLLTEANVEIPDGSIITILGTSTIAADWMVYWLTEGPESGYNKYVLLRMTHTITWKNREGVECSTLGYLYGQEDNMLKEELKSRSRSHVLYSEATKTSFFIAPFNSNIHKDDYFEVTTGSGDNQLTEAYVVTGYDIISAPGIEYVTIDPVYLRDLTPAPEQQSTDNPEDFYWLNGGN